jgi:hypoxanthine-DNA glycosylase
MLMLHSFPPIIDDNSRVLILGSMPGEVSLQKQQYYAHPQNRFWTFVYGIFAAQPDNDYPAKKAFLLSHHIALWDVVESCQRSGSLDSKIINPTNNDFNRLLIQYPAIKTILFNGRKAAQLFSKYAYEIQKPEIQLIILPSSSPANASINQKEKLAAWLKIKELLAA